MYRYDRQMALRYAHNDRKCFRGVLAMNKRVEPKTMSSNLHTCRTPSYIPHPPRRPSAHQTTQFSESVYTGVNRLWRNITHSTHSLARSLSLDCKVQCYHNKIHANSTDSLISFSFVFTICYCHKPTTSKFGLLLFLLPVFDSSSGPQNNQFKYSHPKSKLVPVHTTILM